MKNQEKELAEAIKQKVKELNELNVKAFELGLIVNINSGLIHVFNSEKFERKGCDLIVTIEKIIEF